MTPVYQTKFVATDGYGDCMNAAIASILNLPLETFSHIDPRLVYWWDHWEIALGDLGYTMETRPVRIIPEGPAIYSITTDRIYPEGHRKAGENILHAVIMDQLEIVHDPFPSGSVVKEIHHWYELEEMTEAEKLLHQVEMEGGVCEHGKYIHCLRDKCKEKIKK